MTFYERGSALITLMPMPTAAPNQENGIPATADDVCADYWETLLRGQVDAADVLAEGLARLRDTGRL